MLCSTGNCRAKAAYRTPDGRWWCEDCYEYLYLRLPDPPPLHRRFWRWFKEYFYIIAFTLLIPALLWASTQGKR